MSKISIVLLLSLFLLSCSDEGSSNSSSGNGENRNVGEDRSINADLGGNDISNISDADGDGFLDGVLIDADGDGSVDDPVRASEGLPGIVAPSNLDD